MSYLRRPSLVAVVALSLLLVAAISAAAWSIISVKWIDDLAPNVIAESLSIALTLSVIDYVLRRRDRLRVQPLVEYTLGTIRLGFMLFVQSLVFDYTTTHTKPKPIPDGALDFIALWLADQDAEDASRRPLSGS